ncbi:hypothetical protein MXD81_21305, partial [Microbacteriaceae bacterium K1510]|nr:hypothetical protein [Microbacteriaceae bacterium K1510]
PTTRVTAAGIDDRQGGDAHLTDEDASVWWQTSKAKLLGALLAVAGLGVLAWATGLVSERFAFLPTALIGLAYFGRRAIAGALAGTVFSI